MQRLTRRTTNGRIDDTGKKAPRLILKDVKLASLIPAAAAKLNPARSNSFSGNARL
jgi:hypothetical protein